MSALELWSIDLNLLIVLHVLLEEQSVTRAAERLNRTQSAVSHSLSRLREVFADDLLVRDGRQMVPTPRAAALARSLPGALQHLHAVVQPPRPFSPSTCSRVFRIALPAVAGGVLPALVARLRAEAPGASLLATTTPAPPDALPLGQVDAIVAASARAEGQGQLLGSWPWRVFGRAGHPALTSLTLDQWVRGPHLRVEDPVAERAMAGSALRAAGVERRVGAAVPAYQQASAVLLTTSLLLTAPTVALPPSTRAALDHAPAPVPLAPVSLSVHLRPPAGSPAVTWFGELVRAVFRQAA